MKPLLIIPGMVATVDIITGHKSVLDYLLKPVLKARTGAMREQYFLAEIFGDCAGLFAGKPAQGYVSYINNMSTTNHCGSGGAAIRLAREEALKTSDYFSP